MRRRRLNLGQGDLPARGGPGVSTVGKFERAAQQNFDERTRRQMEDALGWPIDAISEFLAQFGEPDFDLDSWTRSLVSRPTNADREVRYSAAAATPIPPGDMLERYQRLRADLESMEFVTARLRAEMDGLAEVALRAQGVAAPEASDPSDIPDVSDEGPHLKRVADSRGLTDAELEQHERENQT